MKYSRLLLLSSILIPTFNGGVFMSPTLAQTSDSLIVSQLREKGIRFTHDNSVTLLKTGQAKFDDLFPHVRAARESIHMEYFNFRNDSIANSLFGLLKQKAREGVEVRLLFDAFGNSSNNQPLKKHHLEDLRQAGIQIYEFDPIKFPWINHVFARDHRKIVVIDGRVAYTGGMNVADYYINGTDLVGEWHDMHGRFEGSVVNDLQLIFLDTWSKVTGEYLFQPKYYQGGSTLPSAKGDEFDIDSPKEKGKMVGIINREPHTSNEIIRYFYNNAICDARDSIKLINPYFTLNRRLKKNLKAAAKRGVKVEIMLSVPNDIPLTPDCGFYNAHKLMKAGCDVWLFKPGFHHTKIIMVDGKFCTVGSANLNSRSLSWDYEENAVIIDSETTSELIQLFNDEKHDSFLLTPESWNQFRTPWQKFRGWAAHFLAPFL